MSDEFGNTGGDPGDSYPHPLDPSLKDSLEILKGKGGGGGSGSGGSGGGSGTDDEGDHPLKRIDRNFAVLTDHFVNQTTPWYSNLPKWLWTIGIILSLLKAGPELINRINDAQEKRTKAEIKAEVGDKMYYDEGNEDIALKFYEEAININDSVIEYSYKKSFVENMITIRKLLNLTRDFRKEDINEAKLALAKGKELSLLKPGFAEAYVLQGQAHIALGRTNERDYSKAKDALLKAIELDVNNDFALMRLGVVYSELAEIEQNNAMAAKYINNAVDFLKESLYINNQKVINKLKTIVNKDEYDKLFEGKLLKDLTENKSETLFNLEDTIRYLIGYTFKEKANNYNKLIKETFNQLKKEKDNSVVIQSFKKSKLPLIEETLGHYFVDNLKVHDYKDFYILAYHQGVTIDLSTSIDDLKDMLAMNKKSKWANMWLGIVYKNSRNYHLSIIQCKKAVQKDPDFDLGYDNLAKVYLRSRKTRHKAFDVLVKAIKINPNFSQAYYTLAYAYGYQNKYKQGLNYINKAIDINPEYMDALSLKGLLNYEIAKSTNNFNYYKKSVESYSKAIQLAVQPSKRKAELYMRRGKVYMLLGQYENATEDMYASLELRPDYYRTYYEVGNLFSKMKEYNKAIENYRKALKIRPKYSDCYANIAKTYKAMGNNDKALYYYNKAIMFARANIYRQYTERGIYYSALEMNDKALSDYNKSISIRPSFYLAYLKRAELYSKLGEIEKAFTDYDRVVELKPALSLGYLGRAKLLKKLGDYSKAIENCTKALTVKANDLESLKLRSELYVITGQAGLANQDKEKIKQIRHN